MPLKLRPTGLGSWIDKDRPDYIIYTDTSAATPVRVSVWPVR